jgi:hypothetical protein
MSVLCKIRAAVELMRCIFCQQRCHHNVLQHFRHENVKGFMKNKSYFCETNVKPSFAILVQNILILIRNFKLCLLVIHWFARTLCLVGGDNNIPVDGKVE